MTDERVLVGRYQIGELIGRGGMAEVHAGWDTRLGREVAVKVLRSDLARDVSFLQRFRREAQSAAGLNHSSIVAVYDSGEDSATELGGADIAVPFIVMERVHGKTLREMLHERGGPMEPPEACRIMAATLRALSFSHANGLVHRDIKPANVMVTTEGEVKLTDFGIARAIADSAATLTNTSVVVGTAQYLSPEQAQGKSIDARADVYSSGCVLYELLTGRPPFTGDSPLAIAYQHVGQTPQPPSTYDETLSAEIDAVVLHSLAKEPQDRYSSASEFAADLEALAAGRKPSIAVPVPAAVDPADAETTVQDVATAEGAGEGQAGAGGQAGETPEKKESSTDSLPLVLPQASRRRQLLIAVASAIGLALVVTMGVLAYQGKIGDVGGVTVPDVRTKTLQDAQDELMRLGLAADIRRVPNKAAEGIVVRQSPDGGHQAPTGSRVSLDVSSGPGNVTIPELTNYDQAAAQSILKDAGLVVRVESVESNEQGPDRVVRTDPKAGATVPEGATVTLYVSNGKVRVPDLSGKPESEARSILMKLGLKLVPSYVDANGPAGTVQRHDYAGQSVPMGTEVRTLIIRERPRAVPTVTVTVPSDPLPPSKPTASPKPPSPTASLPQPVPPPAPPPAPPPMPVLPRR
ncbi:serine/threonine protein kinase [Austwickia chelonae]|nr:Stk1 family PASTA domain-containing Ser/Thr kinase [Austwickia chelonae]SEW42194.1 serine/threonine protein kinase [Austwickia chelonae]